MLKFNSHCEVRATGKPARIEIVAYSGAIMKPSGMGATVVDLAGMALTPIPLLADHDNTLASIVGSGSPRIEAGKLIVVGTLAAGTAAAEQVLALHRSGVRLQASIGADIESSRFVESNQTVRANGQAIVAPVGGLTIVTKSRLREVSIVAAGADAHTSVSIAAKLGNRNHKAMDQKFYDWVNEMLPGGVDHTDPDVMGNLLANYNGRHQANDSDRAAVSQWMQASGIPMPDDEEMRLRRVERSHEREERIARLEARIPMAHTPSSGRRNQANGDVLTAALCLQGGLSNLESKFDERTLDAADRVSRGLTMQTMLMQAACANGYDARPGESISMGNLKSVLTAAFQPSIRAQGWSTNSISNVVSNVANKFLNDGFSEMGDEWRSISAIKPVKDFKAALFVRLLDSLEYEELGAGGEIKHGTLGDATMSAQAATYAKMLSITRTDIINDDVGALTDVPRRLGRAAGQKFRRLFWTAFLLTSDNFFHSNNSNVLTGSGTSLDSAGTGLTAAIKAFRSQTTSVADGSKLIGGKPAVLLCPPALEIPARRLLNSASIVGGSDVIGSANPFFGLCELVVADFVGVAGGLTNGSDAKWYLFRAPTLAPCMLVAALGGKVEPTVDTAEADFNTLGISMRGYSDVGASRGEALSGLQMAGQA